MPSGDLLLITNISCWVYRLRLDSIRSSEAERTESRTGSPRERISNCV